MLDINISFSSFHRKIKKRQFTFKINGDIENNFLSKNMVIAIAKIAEIAKNAEACPDKIIQNNSKNIIISQKSL